MNKKHFTQSDLVERYLRRELNEDELSRFTFQMVMDKRLREEVENTRMVFKTLRTSPAQTAPPKGMSVGWKTAILILVIAILAGVFFISRNLSDQQTEVKSAPSPIAWNYKPNFYFETLMAGSRDAEFSLEFDKPKEDADFSISGTNLDFEFEARIVGPCDYAFLELEIWPNNPDFFENDEAILKTKVPIPQNGLIEFDATLDLIPGTGLYYFILHAPNEGQNIIALRKFTVNKN